MKRAPLYLFIATVLALIASFVWERHIEKTSEVTVTTAQGSKATIKIPARLRMQLPKNAAPTITVESNPAPNISEPDHNSSLDSIPTTNTSATMNVGNEAATTKLIMAIALTIVFACCALFMILSKRYDGDSTRWAYGVIGTILGYWLG